jgi:hypothetical protein
MKSLVLILLCIPLFEVALYAQPNNNFENGFSSIVDEQHRFRRDSREYMFDVSSGQLQILNVQNDGRCSTERELSVIQGVLVDDFPVNDDTTGETGFSHSSIAMGDNGNFVIAWIDSRYGDYAIFFQRYDSSGIAQGNNQRVNDDAAGSSGLEHTSVAMGGDGSFVIAWADSRNGNSDIYFQRYNASGVAQGNNQRANDDAGQAEQRFLSIAMDGRGYFVIAWRDKRNDNYDIYFQLYDSMGLAQGNNKKVNDDVGRALQHTPSVDMDGNGNFVIAWADYRNQNPTGTPDIYFQRYNPDGVRQSTNQRAIGPPRQGEQGTPSIAMDGSGSFVIAWKDSRNDNYDIYCQRYNASGIALGNYRRVTDNAENAEQWYPSIDMDVHGNFVIAWEDRRNGNRDIYFQRFTSSDIKLGNNQIANDVENKRFWYGTLACAMDNSGNFVIVWEDCHNANAGICFQRYDSTGIAQGKNQKANDAEAIAPQVNPAIAMNGSNNFAIAWKDHRNHSFFDLYFQRYNSSGIAQGNNQIAAQIDWMGAPPSIAMDDPGNFVITWSMVEYLGCGVGSTIEYQRYNSSGIPLGDKQIADYVYYERSVGSSIAMNGSGNFAFVYTRYDSIYFQQYNASGVKQGNEQKVNDMATGEIQNTPVIALDDGGNFVIAWEDHRSGNYDIYFQCYNSMGEAQGDNQKANDDAGSTDQYRPTIAMDDSGNFVIAWEDRRHDNNDIYIQRYNSMGIARGTNERANDDAGSTDQYRPSIAMDSGGNFVIVWEDYRYGADNPDIIGQRYYPDGTKRGSNYRIVADGPFKLETYPLVAANSQQLAFCWMDNRRARGWDIFAKITTWDWEGVTSVPEQRQRPDDFCLFQNYPNPFNPATTIEFALPKSAFVTLKVYNLLGEEVTTLIAEQRAAGIHKLNWDASGLASGVYLYRLEAGEFVQCKKLILIR